MAGDIVRMHWVRPTFCDAMQVLLFYPLHLSFIISSLSLDSYPAWVMNGHGYGVGLFSPFLHRGARLELRLRPRGRKIGRFSFVGVCN